MMKSYTSFIVLIGLFVLLNNVHSYGQGLTCQTSTALCDDITPYPAGTTGATAPAGNNYDCLLSQPDPVFFNITIGQSGSIQFDLQNSAAVDVDFILWGPFPDLLAAEAACGNMGTGGANGNVVDCSYDPQAFESVDIANAQAGEVYIMMVTNYSNAPTDIFSNPNTGTGTIVCPCEIYPTFSETPVASNNGVMVDTSNGAAEFRVCPNDTLSFTIAFGSDQIVDSLGINTGAITIGNAFDPSEYNIYGPFYPNAPLYDSMEYIVEIMVDDDDVGIHQFTLSTINVGPGSTCFDTYPITVIVPGIDDIPERDTICSGQDYQVIADVFPTTNGGTSTYLWTQISGPAASINPNNTVFNPTFSPTGATAGDSMSFELAYSYGSCMQLDTIELFFFDIDINISAAPNPVCAGDPSNLQATLTDTIGESTTTICDSYNGVLVPYAPVAGTGTFPTFTDLDEGITPILPIGFNFNFYCNNYTQFYIHANGYITFTNYTGNTSWQNQFIPDPTTPNNLIAGGWTDLDLNKGGTVDYRTIGVAPNRRLIVSFNNVATFNYDGFFNTDVVTFQIIIYEGTNQVEIHATDVKPNSTSTLTMGMENSLGTLAISPGVNQLNAPLLPNQAILFSPATTTTGSPITYSWTPTNTLSDPTIFNPVATPTAPTTYVVDITNGACTFTDSITVNITGSLPAPTVSCGTATQTSIQFSWTALTLPPGGFYEYSTDGGMTWTNASTSLSATLNSLSPGQTVNILVRGNDGLGNNCSPGAQGPVSCTTLPCALAATVDSIHAVSCFGGSDGAIEITVSGGAPTLTYNWSNGATTEDIAGLMIGSYTVTITDGVGCTITSGPHDVAQPTKNASIAIDSTTDASCGGMSDGAIHTTTSGGTPTYTYIWSNGATTEGVSGIPDGTYTVTVSDANGCTNTATAIVSVPSPITIAFNPIDPLCNGGTGCIGTTVSGGNGNFGYNWSNGAMLDSICGLAAGTYTLTITDTASTGSSGGGPAVICVAVDSVVINEPTAIMVSLDNIDNASCNGANDGAVNITATGGTGTLTYNWSNGQTTQNATGLIAGNYSVTVMDANNCSITAGPHTVNQPTAIMVALDSITNTSCNGANDGAVNITATGGTGTLTYNWSNGQTTQNATGLITGNYSVTIMDANNCSITAGPHTINQPTPLVVVIDSIDNASCSGTTDGAIYASVSGGTLNYTYLWSNGATTEDVTGLTNGLYTLTVSDANGCTDSEDTIVSVPSPITLTFNPIDPLCNGGTGCIGTTVSGGNGNFGYNWSNGAMLDSICGLAAGTYYLTVTDTSGTSGGGGGGPMLIYADDFEAAISNWTLNVATGPNNPNGNTWTISDEEGGAVNGTCSNTTTNNGDETLHITCHPMGASGLCGFLTGAVYDAVETSNQRAESPIINTTGASGLTLNFQFIAMGEALLDNASVLYNDGLGGGWQTLIPSLKSTTTCGFLGDANWESRSVTLPASCDNNPNVQIAFNWTNDGNNMGSDPSIAINNITIIDSVTGGGIGGNIAVCSVIDSVVINEPLALTVTVDSTDDVSCSGGNDGAVYITTTGGTGAISYDWSNGLTTKDITGLIADNYCVTVTDINGCTATTCDSISEPFFNVPQDTFYICHGDSVQIAVNTNGGIITWTPGRSLSDSTSSNPFAKPDTTTTYIVSVGGSQGNLIANGDFESGNTGFTSQYSYGGAMAGGYVIDTNANVYNGQHSGYDHTTGSGNYLIADGSSSNTNVWCQTVNVNVNTDYDFSTWFNNIVRPTSNFGDPTLQVTINGIPIITTPAITENPDQWLQFTATWNSGAATTANICIRTVGASGAGHDFGIDDISFTGPSSCAMVDSVTVIVSDPVVSIAPITISCNGDSTGCLTATTTGGFETYTYNWSNGNSTNNMCNLPAGDYTVTVTDSLGCIDTSTYNMTEPTAITITLDSIDNLSCNGANDGAVYITAAGGTGTLTYNWSNGLTTQNATGLTAGNYSITVLDANGCSVTSSPHNVTEPTAITITLDSIDNISCNGANDGAVYITAAGGTGTLTYNWSNGLTIQNATGLMAGSYSVTVLDANGCSVTSGPHNVTEPTAITITLDSIDNISCNGANDGAVYITAAGGTGTLTYNWSNGLTTQNATGLIAGSYSVTVLDANGCSVTSGPHNVTEPTAISIVQDSTTAPSCNGTSDGAIYITASGGTTNYNFTWSTGATTEDLIGIASGSYTVTLTDANNCGQTFTTSINQPGAVSLSLDASSNVDCAGNNNGTISITASGGNPAYTFIWSNGATDEDLTGLAGGVYTCTVADQNSCTDTLAITITEPTALIATLDSTQNVSCGGSNDGAAFISVSGGTGSYTFAWNNSSTTEDINALAVGTYTVTVTDANNCMDTLSASVGSASGITIVDTVANASCNGGNDGSINLTVSGGTPGYTFLWSTNATTQNISGLSAGTYTVTITDNVGCAISYTPTAITAPTAVNVSLVSSSDPTCGAGNDGSIDISVSGGTANYTFVWSNGTTLQNITNLEGGTYSVTVTDANNCVGTNSVTLTTASGITLAVNSITGILTCDLASVGELQAVPTPTDTAITYIWSNGATTANINNLGAGNYTVTATTNTGCTATSSATVVAPVVPKVNAFVNNAGTTDTTVTWNDEIMLHSGNDQSAQGVTYAWTFTGPANGDLGMNTASAPTTTALPTEDGLYNIVLTATATTSGVVCTDQDSLNVTVKAKFQGVPNAFTPNGDGENDLFRPIGLEAGDIIEFKVYNRWGQVVYDGDNLPNSGWDGKLNNIDQPRDVYIYTLRFKQTGDEEETTMRGSVTLIR